MSGFTASLRAFSKVFENPRVRNLQIAGAGSTLGTWAYAVALPVFAYHAGGARAVGLLFFARYVLGALAAPWLGVLADRWSRQRLMLTADLVRTGIFAGMTAVAVAHGSPYAVYVLAVTSTIVSGSFPPAQAALLPLLVETPEELTAANLVGNTISSMAMFAGPAIGGVLLALSGPAAVFALNGGLFVWSAAFVLQVGRDERPQRIESERGHFLSELTAGFSTVAHDRALRVIVLLTTAETLVVGALEVLLVVLALRLLHSGNAGVGWLNTTLGIGSVAGAAVVAVLASRRRLAGGFALGLILTGAPFALLAAVHTLAPALVLLAVVGAGSIVVEVSGMTLMQRSAENEVLGRVFAVLQSLIMGSLALGSVIAPGLVSWLGPRGALIAAGVFLPALLIPLWPSLLRIDAASRIAVEPLALLRGVEIFAQLPEPVLERLAASATTVTAAPGEAVVTRGEPGQLFYVIASGRVVVELDGASPELGPGDFFGEIALLRDVPRTATVRAVDELRLYAIEREEFLAALTGHGPSLAAAETVMASRVPAGALAG